MTTCLFCKILAGEIPSEKVYEDAYTYAFLDLHPVNKGHTLVVPKEHTETITETSDETLAQCMHTVKKVAIALESIYGPAVNVITNNGKEAGQVIFHLHFHVIPRQEGDGHAQWHGVPYKENEMTEVGSLLRERLNTN